MRCPEHEQAKLNVLAGWPAGHFDGCTFYCCCLLFVCRDQRITQDVDRFCDEVSQALPKIILQPFLIAYYSYRTFIRLEDTLSLSWM